MKEMKHSLKYKVAELTEAPKDVVMGLPVLTVIGHMELYLENHRGILAYTDTDIKIQTKSGQIKVSGKKLQVGYYTDDEMEVKGCIDSIEYLLKQEG